MNKIFILISMLLISCSYHLYDFEHIGTQDYKNLESNQRSDQNDKKDILIFNKECKISNERSIYLCQIQALNSIYKVYKMNSENFEYLKNISANYKLHKGYIQIIIKE